ncbi:MAG TPA: class II aldolase/adducin family protein [Vicinamibacteria bacterium]|jgi:ribulose-5-phosphate 4-epimerase/fuculose-1-phosphate aldolase
MSKPTIRDLVSAEEWKVRMDLAACYRMVARQNWHDLVYTHISARVPGERHHYLVNPFGLHFHEITASSLVKVDDNCNVVLDTGFPVNPAAFVIHGAIHRAREDAGCVLHLHTVAGVGVATQRQGLLPITQTALLFEDNVAYHAYEGLAVAEGECERLVADLGSKPAMLLQNHGTLTVAETISKAFVLMWFLERACQMQVAALSGGAEFIVPPEDVRKRVRMQAAVSFQQAGIMEWAGVLRTLEREEPDYRN